MSTDPIETRDPVVVVAEILWHLHNTNHTHGVGAFLHEAEVIVAAVVERIAAGFDAREEVASVLPRAMRDMDTVLAWSSAARLVRSHGANRPSAAVETTEAPSGTPGHPRSVMDWLDATYPSWWLQPIESMPSGLQAEAWERRARPGVIATNPPADPAADVSCATCGCEKRWHDGPSGRCCGDFLACRCKAYSPPATSPTGDPTK